MRFGDVRAYTILIEEYVADEHIRSSSPLQFSATPGPQGTTAITFRADQSGLVGLIRHLHSLGLVILSLGCSAEDPAGPQKNDTNEKGIGHGTKT